MQKFKSLALATSMGLTALGLTVPSAHAVNINVFASSAPNFFGSPSFAPWQSSGMCFLQGTCAEGDRNTSPEAFETLTSFAPGDATVTGFNSWRGQADPGVAFGAGFGSELGNRMHFPVSFISENAADTFTLSDIFFDISSSDSGVSAFGGSGVLGFSGNLAGTTFNGTSRIGIFWGDDGLQGTADDVLVNSGEADGTLVNELYYVGVGNALVAAVPEDGATEQEALDAVALSFENPGDPIASITGTYTVGNSSGSATVRLATVPEPGTLALLGIGLVGLGLARRRIRIR